MSIHIAESINQSIATDCRTFQPQRLSSTEYKNSHAVDFCYVYGHHDLFASYHVAELCMLRGVKLLFVLGVLSPEGTVIEVNMVESASCSIPLAHPSHSQKSSLRRTDFSSTITIAPNLALGAR